jgi:putative DNA primase/helicase
VDGKPQPVRDFRSRYIYEVGPSLEFANAEPLSDAQAQKFPELCSMLSWHRPISAKLLAGWCVTAPGCGAWEWRSPLFLSGQAQSGKSWCISHLVTPMVGKIGLFAAATTSEAGIRRALRCDARPVIIDELEGADAKSVERIRAIFHLFRYATSETGAEIVMGKQGGGTETFRPRFQGMTSAIGSLLTDYADVTRHTTCSLKIIAGGAQRERQFAEIKRAHRDLLTPAYIAGMQARMVALIPTIRANAETFAVAGAEVIGARRVGDQLGLLAAGCHACYSSGRITAAAATAWWEKQELDEERETIQDTDGPSCFARIMEHKLPVDGIRGRVERSIGELVAIMNRAEDAAVSYDIAAATLGRNGIMAKDRLVWISNSHTAIAEILRGTPWPVNWRDRLLTIPGSMISDGSWRFAPGGAKTRAVGVPVG